MTAAPQPHDISKLRVLQRAHQLGQGGSNYVTVAALVDSFEADSVPLDLPVATGLELLETEQLVHLDRRLGNVIAAAKVSATGQAAVAAFETARASKTARRCQLRDDYLDWLHEQIEELDNGPTPDDYLATTPSYLGVPYEPVEVEKAGTWLAEMGFIKGQSAWQYSGPSRPALTAKGRHAVENSLSTREPNSPAGNIYNTQVAGNAVIAQEHSTITQTTNNTWVKEGNNLLDGIQESLLSLPGEIRDSMTLATAEAREALHGKPDVDRLRGALNRIAGFLSQTGSGALGGILGAQVLTYLATLP